MGAEGARSRIETGIAALDGLLKGGIPRGALVQIFGERALGKSIFSLQLAFAAMKAGESVMVIDTEQSWEEAILRYWCGRFEGRFGIAADVRLASLSKFARRARGRRVREHEIRGAIEAALNTLGVEYTGVQLENAARAFLSEAELVCEVSESPALYLLEAPSIEDLFLVHGIKAAILVTESGRVEVRLMPGGTLDPLLSPLGALVERAGVGLVVYDSISMPLKAAFVGTQDFPGRAAAIALVLGRVQKLCASTNLTALVVNHVSQHPITGQVKPFGGQIIGYEFKFSFMMDRVRPQDEKIALNAVRDANRALRVHRHPELPEFSSAVLLRLGESGFADDSAGGAGVR